MERKQPSKTLSNGLNIKTVNMLRKTVILISLVIWSSLAIAQVNRFEYKGSRVLMDSTWNTPEEPVVKGIIAKYKPEMDKKMQEVIGISVKEMRSARPESLLSNFAADAMVDFASSRTSGKVDFALTNFGGIRAALPAGNVRLYDVYSVFPFENYVVILDLKGKTVRALFESFAKNRVEALSDNVRLEIDETNRTLNSALINGKPVDDNKIYRIVTIDFLLSGGDNVVALKDAVAIEETGLLIRDAIIEKIATLTAKGEKIGSVISGRVKYSD